MNRHVSALYIRADGPYPKLVVDCWTADRDARMYAGSNPVVAHPPCARWSRYWYTARHLGRGLGDDDGCFAAAIAAVRQWGGVLEHPEGTNAFARFGILRPAGGGWTVGLLRPDEWTCSVDQGAYGHRARKRTWLVYVGSPPPALNWLGSARVTGAIESMCRRERELTPEPFARMLVGLAARSAR